MTATAAGTLTREVAFDAAVASLDAVQRAAYRFGDRLSIDLHPGETITCVLQIGNGDDADDLAAAFRNEVLDQVLRERIRTETAAARNLILAVAFSQTGTLAAD